MSERLVYVATDNCGVAYICAEPIQYVRIDSRPVKPPIRMTKSSYYALPNCAQRLPRKHKKPAWRSP